MKDGATVTTKPQDVLQALAPISELDLFSSNEAEEPTGEEAGERSLAPPPNDDERLVIVQALGPTPVEIDDIIRHTGLPASSVYLVLLELDIAGRLERHAGGFVSLSMMD